MYAAQLLLEAAGPFCEQDFVLRSLVPRVAKRRLPCQIVSCSRLVGL